MSEIVRRLSLWGELRRRGVGGGGGGGGWRRRRSGGERERSCEREAFFLEKTKTTKLTLSFLFLLPIKKTSGVTQLYVVGGNGGNAAANAIHDECERAGVVCSVVGVPKSIDNDILLIDRCFGFDTAVEEAQRSLLAAKVEASSAHRGVGLVRLMGRQSG